MLEPLRGIRAAILVLALTLGGPAWAAAPDATLYTTYTVTTGLTSASWLVCGATAQSEGCFAVGTLGPFGRIGAMLESHPATEGQTVTRQVYVLDVASGTGGTGVTLFTYTKQDVITDSSDIVTVSLKSKIALPLTGGASVTGMMAANTKYICAGTSQSTQAVSIERSKGVVTGLGGFSPPLTVAAITADAYGYVTVTYGAPGAQASGFYVFGPTGAYQGDGGGAQFMLDASNAVIPAPLPP